MRTPFLILLSTTLLLLAACKPCNDPTNPECPNYCDDPRNRNCFNYDPCLRKSDVTAAFRMEEDVPYVIRDILDFRYIDSDTSSSPQVRFTALDPDATYEWYIGAGRYTKRQFSLRFDDIQRDSPGLTIPVTLVTTKVVDTACFPGSTGKDTLTRYLTIMDRCSTKISGSFLGKWVNKPGQTDTFTVKIMISESPNYPGISCFLHTITNLEGPGSDCANWSTGIAHNFRQISIGNSFGPEPGICNLDRALAWTEQGSDSITIQYRMEDRSVIGGPTEYFVFKGIRTKN